MLLNKKLISNYLNPTTLKIIQAIHIEDSITSTNDILSNEIKSNPQKIIALFAEEQTEGRGRLGRPWISPKNKNIYFSLSWHFNKPVSELSGLSLAVGIALIYALKKITPFEKTKIKWPNDILFNDKKLAGILIETVPRKTSCSVIIGIGLNVNLQSDETKKIDQPWTSLSQITHTQHDRNLIAASLLNALCDVLPEFEKNGLLNFMDDWKKHDALFGKHCDNTGAQKKSGIVVGINLSGELLLKTDNKIEAVSAGEIGSARQPL